VSTTAVPAPTYMKFNNARQQYDLDPARHKSDKGGASYAEKFMYVFQ